MRKPLLIAVAAMGMTALAAPVLACAMHETAQSKAVDSLAQTKTTTTKPTMSGS